VRGTSELFCGTIYSRSVEGTLADCDRQTDIQNNIVVATLWDEDLINNQSIFTVSDVIYFCQNHGIFNTIARWTDRATAAQTVMSDCCVLVTLMSIYVDTGYSYVLQLSMCNALYSTKLMHVLITESGYNQSFVSELFISRRHYNSRAEQLCSELQ